MAISIKQKISMDETVALLGVSTATIRNWIRHNYILPEKISTGKLMFDYSEVINLKEKLHSGQINRLNSRANKRNSGQCFIPDEYADSEEVIQFIAHLSAEYLHRKWE